MFTGFEYLFVLVHRFGAERLLCVNVVGRRSGSGDSFTHPHMEILSYVSLTCGVEMSFTHGRMEITFRASVNLVFKRFHPRAHGDHLG